MIFKPMIKLDLINLARIQLNLRINSEKSRLPKNKHKQSMVSSVYFLRATQRRCPLFMNTDIYEYIYE